MRKSIFLILLSCVFNLFAYADVGPVSEVPLGETQRIALIVANSDYAGEYLDLRAPENDAQLVNDRLTSLGFEVMVIENASRTEMDDSIRAFRTNLETAPRGSVGLFYYSGHGTSIRRGDDYLLGVNSDFTTVADIQSEALSYKKMVSQFSDLGGKGLVFAMDTNRVVHNLPAETRSIGKGFVEVDPPEMFEIWASQIGDWAVDVAGPGGVPLSPFSQALSEGLEIPGADIREVFARIQSRVLELTDGNQYPDVLISTTSNLVLNNSPVIEVETKSTSVPLVQSSGSVTNSSASLELTLFEAARELGTAEAMRDFLDKFPNSLLSDNAKLRLKALEMRPEEKVVSSLDVLQPTVRYAGPKRVALLIGNKSYAPNLNDLTNPHNDVALISERLRSIGFEVVVIQDATHDATVEGLSRFLTLLTPAQNGDRAIAFFYYSGHGFAPENSGRNYLVPIGLELNSETDLLRALTVEAVVERVQALKPAFAFYAFDACRNDPGLPAVESDDGSKSTDGTKGFTPVPLASHSLIAYATALGEKAYDTPDADTGPYAQALASALEEPGLDASAIFKRAQRAAHYASGRRQVPWIADGLIDEVILNNPMLNEALE